MKTVDYATIVTPDEMQDARQWLADRYGARSSAHVTPFSSVGS